MLRENRLPSQSFLEELVAEKFRDPLTIKSAFNYTKLLALLLSIELLLMVMAYVHRHSLWIEIQNGRQSVSVEKAGSYHH
jgi:hypothetical protein